MSRQPQSVQEATLPCSVNSEKADSKHRLQQEQMRAMSQLGNAPWAPPRQTQHRGELSSRPPARDSLRGPEGKRCPGPCGIQVMCFNWKGDSVPIQYVDAGFKSHLPTTEGLKRPPILFAASSFLSLLLPFSTLVFGGEWRKLSHR